MAQLRWFQNELKKDIQSTLSRKGVNILAVAPTGSGKTVLMGSVAKDWPGVGVAIAHRQELVSQISLALAREGIPHQLHAPEAVRKLIRTLHIHETGRQWVSTDALWHVAGVDTLLRMNAPWMKSVTLIMQDEAHHVLRDNKWGKVWKKFPQANGLGVTATPGRADGRGLGAHADGVFHAMTEKVGMRQLIEEGYLTDYRVIAPDPSDLGLDTVEISSATGDFNATQLQKHFQRNTQIIGDVVRHYLHYAPGKLGVTFCVDLACAERTAEQFRAAGVPAEVISSDTPDRQRHLLLNKFKNREFLQLVSVDILGEGFDLPAIEVVSLARPTQSLPLFIQQCGRVMRLMISKDEAANWENFTVAERLGRIAASRKPQALIIDHVGNILRHLPPDKPRLWSLDRRSKGESFLAGDAIPLRVCLNVECLAPYEKDLVACPYCGEIPPAPADVSTVAAVSGDLLMLDPAVLASMRQATFNLNAAPAVPVNAGPVAVNAFWKHHNKRCKYQLMLCSEIDKWCAQFTDRPASSIQRRFYFIFGIDILSACSLRTRDAELLIEKIRASYNVKCVG